jgi:hypothetical protein
MGCKTIGFFLTFSRGKVTNRKDNPKRVLLSGEQATMKPKALSAHQSQAQFNYLESLVESEEIFWPVSGFIDTIPTFQPNPKNFLKMG